MPDARRRILAAAIQCFASRGYAATTIADIEQAAGLSVGAGGTYRHFESKRAILEAVVDAAVGVPDDEIAPPSDDIEATAHEMLDYMRADMMRIYFRDLDDFPDQRKRINERTIDTSYRRVAERIAAGNPSIDAEAAAAVILGSLINFRVNETLVGDDANGVDRDRFVRTWAAIYRQISGEETGGTTMPKPKDVDAYIAAAPAQARPILEELRTIVLTTIPNVEEKISWGVPFYRHHGEIGGFAAYAKHVSVGFGAVATSDRTALEAKGYKVLKDTFQIKFDQKVPAAAIRKILKAKVKANG